MPAHFYPILALIILAYVISAELVKRVFTGSFAETTDDSREEQFRSSSIGSAR